MCIRDRRKSGTMKRLNWKIAMITLLALAGPAWAGEDLAVRNCTWCHGTSGQGYMMAPRLAGQRPQYIESQMRSFREHTRDNPFSKQYMWYAVAALSPQAARDLATVSYTHLTLPTILRV